jgi:hypothetical protein
MARFQIGPGAHQAALGSAVLMQLVVLSPSGSLAEQPQAQGSKAPIEQYEPDQQTCTPERQLAAFSHVLAPYADQPPAVLEQLRSLQRQLTARSLRSCLLRDLLSPDQVERLVEAMGLAVPAQAPQAKDSTPLAAPKPAAVKPAPPTPQPVPSSNPNPSAFDRSPIEWKPARITPFAPKDQNDPFPSR